LRLAGVRADVTGGERLPKLVRSAEKQKVPVMCVVGAEEQEARTLAVRTYADGEQGKLPLDEVVARLTAANNDRLDAF